MQIYSYEILLKALFPLHSNLLPENSYEMTFDRAKDNTHRIKQDLRLGTGSPVQPLKPDAPFRYGKGLDY
jgi:hypothetical protein